MGGNEIRGKDLGMCLDDLSPGRVQPYARLVFPLERYDCFAILGRESAEKKAHRPLRWLRFERLPWQ